MSQFPPVGAPVQSQFDKFAFLNYMDNHGKAYRHQAIELITICQVFLHTTTQLFVQDAALTKVLQVCDRALSRAAEARKESVLSSADDIQTAIRKLHDYESKFHLRHQDGEHCVRERMKRAKEEDAKSWFGRKLENMTKSEDEEPTVVEFHLLGSLTGTRPPVVSQALTKGTKLQEIIWNFIRLSHKLATPITLAQNPHFYIELPTTSSNAKCRGCTSHPIEHYRDTHSIYVLTNTPGRRVFLEFGGNCRAFDNLWETKNHLIFKDVCGKLECESSVEKSIRGQRFFWCRVEPLPSQPMVKSPVLPLTPAWTHVGDWKQAVRHALSSPDIKIRILIQ